MSDTRELQSQSQKRIEIKEGKKIMTECEPCTIDDLSIPRELRVLEVRILRLWKVFGKDGEATSINMLIIDRKGVKIQATIKSADSMIKHKAYLLEGRVIAISKFNVVRSEGKYLVCKNPFHIFINYGSKVELSSADDLPQWGWDFIPFNEILSTENTEKYLIDAIGVIIEHGSIENFQSRGVVGQRLNFLLSDEAGHVLPVCLFGHHVAEMLEELNSPDYPKVVVLQLAKINKYSNNIALNTYWDATKVMVNPPLDEVQTFRQISTQMVLAQTQSQGAYSDGTQATGGRTSLTDPTLRKSIIEIKESQVSGKFTTLAMVKEIIEDNNWCYNSCSKCNKQIKTIHQSGADLHWCPKCVDVPKMTIPRFKVQLRVADSTGEASFILFDKEAFILFNKTAIQLREELIKAEDEFGFPEVLYEIVNKEFVFLVEVNQRFNIELNKENYGILYISALEEHLKEFRTTNLDLQASSSDKLFSPTEEDHNHVLPIQSQTASNTAVREGGLDDFITPDNSGKRKALTISTQDLEEIVGISEFQTPQMSSSKGIGDIKYEKD